MRVFVTGATGFIGSAIVRDLVEAGHCVIGLARSAQSAVRIEAAGATAFPGSLEDLEKLKRGAAAADGVIHTAFFHAISQPRVATRFKIMRGGRPTGIITRFMTAAVEADKRAIEALGSGLRDGRRPIVVSMPTMAMTQGQLAREVDIADPTAVGGLRARSESAALSLAAQGVRASIIRLPPSVHDESRQGLVTQLIKIARKKGLSAYIDEGNNRWAAVHRQDAARLFRLALENGESGARYHAVAEEAIPFGNIAKTIGNNLCIPVQGIAKNEAAKQFGWLAPFVGADNPIACQTTQERLCWSPVHSQLIPDIVRYPNKEQATPRLPSL